MNIKINTNAIRDKLRFDDKLTLEFLENHIDEFQKNDGDLTELWLDFLNGEVAQKVEEIVVDCHVSNLEMA